MTNRVAMRTVEEFMSDYQPVYQPLYPLFMSRAQAYPEVVGQLDFRRAEAVGDIRGKRITPKDTHIHQIAVAEGKKSFKKYFDAAQLIQSIFQDQSGTEDVIKQVLDENQKLQDELFLLGEGTSNSTMLNNGLFWSADANYILNNSVQVAKGTDADHLKDLHAKIMAQAEIANQQAGQKVLIYYGSTMSAKFNSLYATSDSAFRAQLAEALGEGWSITRIPADVTPAGAEGFMVVNLDQVKTHYTVLPELKGQGTNEEKMHTWHNFLMGSMMLEVLVYGAVIRQPVTYES